MSGNVTTEMVKELRDATGISVMQCRKALEEAEGDMNKAVAILKKASAGIAEKKADREAKDGAITVKSSVDRAVLVSLHCETDFVSKNEDFRSLLSALADLALSEGMETMKSKAKEMIDPIIQKTGEKIELGEAYEIKGDVLGSYVHNGKKAVVVALSGGSQELARDVAMHVAAMNPEYISAADVDAEAKKTMTEVFEKEVAESDKSEEIKKKILEGKLTTYFKEKTLLDQPFVKNPEQTVGQLLQSGRATIKELKKYSI
jgi:elongation factor Ts